VKNVRRNYHGFSACRESKKEATAIRSPCEIARRHLLAFVIMDEEEEGFRMLKRNNPRKFLEEKKKKKNLIQKITIKIKIKICQKHNSNLHHK